MNKAVRGVYAAAISPFRADGSLDTDKLVGYCQYLMNEGGCDGVAPTGTTGEGNSIGLNDKLVLPKAFAKAGIPTERVIFGTGACSTADAILLSRNAVEHGFQNVLVLPPFYYKAPSDEGLYRYFAQLIEGVGSDALRVYLYHFPQMSAVPFSTDVVMRLKNDFGAIIAGLKDSSGDFEQSRAFADATGGVRGGFDIYPSSEAMYFEGKSAGCAGIISGSTNVFANKVKAAIKAGGGDAFEAVKTARALAAKYPLMAAMKQIEAWRSSDDNWLRMAPPLVPLSDAQRISLRADLDALEPTGAATL